MHKLSIYMIYNIIYIYAQVVRSENIIIRKALSIYNSDTKLPYTFISLVITYNEGFLVVPISFYWWTGEGGFELMALIDEGQYRLASCHKN